MSTINLEVALTLPQLPDYVEAPDGSRIKISSLGREAVETLIEEMAARMWSIHDGTPAIQFPICRRDGVLIDAAGAAFDPALHGYNVKTHMPAVTRHGVFKKRRGTVTQTTPAPEALPPVPRSTLSTAPSDALRELIKVATAAKNGSKIRELYTDPRAEALEGEELGYFRDLLDVCLRDLDAASRDPDMPPGMP